MNENAREYGFHFESSACAQCPGHCCTGPRGYVWLSIDEMEKIAVAIGLPFVEFTRRYTRRIGARFSLREEERGPNNFACVFFAGGCTIYESRPHHCRSFPFWPQFKGRGEEVAKGCPGVRLGPSSPGFASRIVRNFINSKTSP